MPDTALPQFTECNSLALRRASRTVGQMYDRHLAQAGLRGGQFSILVWVSRLGPVGMSALATGVGLDRTTLNRVLKPLLRDGLVAVGASDSDKRSRLLSLTPEGKAKLAEARLHWEAAQAAFETTYGVSEAARLRELLSLVGPG